MKTHPRAAADRQAREAARRVRLDVYQPTEAMLGCPDPFVGHAVLPRLAQLYALLRGVRRIGGQRLLDVGGREGHFAALCRDLFGMETAAGLCAVEAARRAQEIGRVVAFALDPARLPFEDGLFDVVVCSSGLDHTHEPVAALLEMARVARRGVVVPLQPPAAAVADAHSQEWWERFGGEQGLLHETALRQLFPECSVRIEQASTAPPPEPSGDLIQHARYCEWLLSGDPDSAPGLASIRSQAADEPVPRVASDEEIARALILPAARLLVPPHQALSPWVDRPGWYRFRCRQTRSASIRVLSGDVLLCQDCGKELLRNGGIFDLRACPRRTERRPSADRHHPAVLSLINQWDCPPPVGSWDFAGQAAAEWTVSGVEALGRGRYRSISGNPMLVSPWLDIDVATIRGVEVCLSVEAADRASEVHGALRALMNGQQNFDDHNCLRFVSRADGSVQEHWLAVPDDARRQPLSLARLRLDPMSCRGSFTIHSVRLIRDSTDGDALTAAKRQERLQVFSHRRSGTHFLIELLRLNLPIEVHKSGHNLYEDTFPYPFSLYIYRDGRDVLLSNYHWWREAKEAVSLGVRHQLRNCSFAEFVRGEVPVTVPEYWNRAGVGPVPQDYFRNPARFWARHVAGFLDQDPVRTVRFEDLKADPEREMRAIAERLGYRLDRFVPLEKMVGHHPRAGEVGGAARLFDRELEDVFWRSAGEVMERCDYQRYHGRRR